MLSALLRFKTLIFFLIFTFFFITVDFAFAQSSNTPPQPSPSPCTDNQGCPITSQNYKAAQNADYSLTNIQSGLLCQLAGISPAGKCVGLTNNGGKIVAMEYDHIPNGGAVGGLALAMGSVMSSPPTSSTQYLADLGSNLGLVSPAYAQVTGSGDSVVRPVYALWQAVRNLAYFAFIVIFMVVGLMIMFRSKIGGQNAVTIQAALPGLVMGLILVTFSYFIAAVLVDLSFLGMQVAVRLFDPGVVGPNYFGDNLGRLQEYANTSSVFDLFRGAALRPQNISDVAGGLANIVFQGPGSFGISALVTGVVGGVIGFMLGGPIGIAAGAVGGPLLAIPVLSLIIPLILVVALIVQLFRLLFELINSYIQILILTIAGPIYCLVASLPGRGSALNNWWRCILANSLVFPAVFVAFLFAGFILASNGSWQSTLPLFGGIGTTIIKLFVAYGIMLGTPAIPPMVRNALGCKGPQEYARAAMQGYMSGINVTRGAATMGWNKMMGPVKQQKELYAKSVAEARLAGKTPPTPPPSPMAGARGPLGWNVLQGALRRYMQRGTGVK